MSSHVGPYEWKPGPGNVLERVLKPAHVLKANSIARERAKAARRETLGEVSIGGVQIQADPTVCRGLDCTV